MAGIGRSTRYIAKLKKIVKAEIPAGDPAHLELVKDIARVEPTCWRWKRPSCASWRRWRAASIRDRMLRIARP